MQIVLNCFDFMVCECFDSRNCSPIEHVKENLLRCEILYKHNKYVVTLCSKQYLKGISGESCRKAYNGRLERMKR